MSTGATTNFQIPLFGDADFVTPIQTPLNAQSNALDTALTKAAFVTYPTKAALNLVPGTVVGQHATVNADSTAVNNGDYAWSGTAWVQTAIKGAPADFFNAYAMAAGIATNPAGSNVVVQFPVGRFTVPPLVAMANTSVYVSALNAQNITTTQATMGGYTNATGASAPTTFMWIAVQMTPTSAAG